MTASVDWAIAHARMIFALILLSLVSGIIAYIQLPKEGEPDIDIPALFVSVPFPGISAEDSEKLIVKPLENKLKNVDGLKDLSATAAESYAGIFMQFEFGWDKTATIADVRDKVNQAQSEFPDGAEQYTINEINFSRFPILVISLSGSVPEHTILKIAKRLQDSLESMSQILEVGLAGHRNEMIEVLINPLKLEAYSITASDMINVVRNNNLLIAAGSLETKTGAFAFKIPAAFDEPSDIGALPVRVYQNRTITLNDIADIRLTFEDRIGTARFNGQPTLALQVVKRKGVNLIDTINLVKQKIAAETAQWPEDLQRAVSVNYSSDQSVQVSGMVNQLESSVLTAVALVMIVVLASLGIRSALLVGFAIPTSFLLAFAIMATNATSISNIVMFGLILSVGMLVDGAIVVVEYADKKIAEGIEPMKAYGTAAKRMFWPIVSSTATTLCAFLPMLFWPGVAGEFMGQLPVTLIYVLSASLLVSLIYLPVVGGVSGRFSHIMQLLAQKLKTNVAFTLRFCFLIAPIALIYWSAIGLLRGNILLGISGFAIGTMILLIIGGSLQAPLTVKRIKIAHQYSIFGRFIHFLVGNPIMPIVTIIITVIFVIGVGTYYSQHNKGVEFFVETEPEDAIIYVRARGNFSLQEKDTLVKKIENLIRDVDNIQSVFSFSGQGGLDNNTGGAQAPLDTVGQIQIEMTDWDQRLNGPSGTQIINEIRNHVSNIPGVQIEIFLLEGGPASGKAINLRVKGQNWQNMLNSIAIIRDKFETIAEMTQIEDTLPLPGIDWKVEIDTQKAGLYQADVAQIGTIVQLVTRGLELGVMRIDTSDEEIDIRVRFPKKNRLISTLETIRMRTAKGLIPISNFIVLKPVPKLGQINRSDGVRYFDIKADVVEGSNANDVIAQITQWLNDEQPLAASVSWQWQGDQDDQRESQQFLLTGFIGALGLMFAVLLTQFNSFYNSVLVLLAVVLSITGVLIGMLVMDQTFSIIMTGTGILALAGIVVNNNIVLIDTYQEFAKIMPPLQAIVYTVQERIRPVILTTITTIAGLTPMMFGISINFYEGGYTIDAPTALWWKQLATAVVFGLSTATLLTLILTPSLLAVRIWVTLGAYRITQLFGSLMLGKDSTLALNRQQDKKARKQIPPQIQW